MADNDNENKCPLCGKQAAEGDNFCKDCQEIAQNAYPEELLTRQEIDEILEDEGEELVEVVSEESEAVTVADPPQQESFSQSNKKWLVFLGIGIGLLIAVGAFSSYNFIQRKSADETETAYWHKSIEENTPLSYSKYLVQYPDGKYVVEAETKIRVLRENERKEWEELRNSNNVDALFRFMTDHPETPYTREIRHAIDSLSWITTTKENTAAAYLAYIENVKLGRYTGEYEELAQQKYDYLSQLKKVEGEDLTAVKTVLTKLFKSLSETDAKDLVKVTGDSIHRFYSSQNKASRAIIDSLKAHRKSDKIKTVVYAYIPDSIEVIKDNKGIYFITAPVSEEITFNDRKKKKERASYTINMEMNDKKQVKVLYKAGSK
ncbi:hypothetical protein M2451_000427 [Dysgonomonas sp. PFB1-18]|uniref:zinc ribbon domain-containing protein n=1 Tax=unclassified Dysgonomonas TaxID=2630389 RepID=UPI00247613CD|nr:MULTISPECIES: zinc ribbon domain-containing protein [unclassified Dysgonomonas]MDH6307278.1 hypothetical protein [Dysgonomonas sp. PF1-14]MDH6337196.1 hypothetical protein [Dysgonomonas sp. PF1-16]MDH6379120.1 hypothetical protein [Dysgonomonas sp. PFB1-18]MDH6396243.1 hypothetical protein [Dysgonomonas sp. PF1-23]